MKPSIILEGPNGSGKSTLGKELSSILGIPYMHAGPDPGSFMNVLEACVDQLTLLKKGVILDRCTPISRVIYQNDLTTTDLMILAAFYKMMEKYADCIYCVSNGEFSEKPYYPPGHFKEVKDKHAYIRAQYDLIFSRIRCHKYDWTKESINDLIKRVIHD